MNPVEVNVQLQQNNYEYNLGMNESISTDVNDYEQLNNLPSINGVTLIGDKTTEDLHIESGVTGIKGAAEEEFRKGNVSLSPTDIGTYSKDEIDQKVKEPTVDEEVLKL